MMGDRYGEVTKVTWSKAKVANSYRAGQGAVSEIAHVKLDKSGKTVRVLLDDCEVL